VELGAQAISPHRSDRSRHSAGIEPWLVIQAGARGDPMEVELYPCAGLIQQVFRRMRAATPPGTEVSDQ
jgi:hypothetical protein